MFIQINYVFLSDENLTMKIITNIWESVSSEKSVITIGTFDGVHLGHQKIIQRLVDTACKSDLLPVVFTFFPHPRMILQPQTAPKQIQTIEEKCQMLEKLGVKCLVIQPFDKDFSELSAEDFVSKILVEKLNAQKIIIGYDHRFGKNRTAGIADLQAFGKKFGFSVEEISAQEIDEVAVSSTKIRKALQEGQIQHANACLGHHFTLSGEVIHGKKIGGKLHFPTANIYISESYKMLPREGVYAVYSLIDGQKIFGMMNIGNNPTIQEKEPSVEVHFFDFQGDLYGKRLTLYLLEYIREEQKFSSLEALKHQLENDQEFIVNHILPQYKK